VFEGELFVEHRAACEAAMCDAMRAVDAPFDVVLTNQFRLSARSESVSSREGNVGAAKVVKSGGTIVCAAECRDGLPSHGSYGEVLASQPSPDKLLAMITSPGTRSPISGKSDPGAIADEGDGDGPRPEGSRPTRCAPPTFSRWTMWAPRSLTRCATPGLTRHSASSRTARRRSRTCVSLQITVRLKADTTEQARGVAADASQRRSQSG